MRKPALLLAAAWSLAFVGPVPAALAAPTSLFILDSSGSMWGRLPDKKSKIIAARSVMGGLVQRLPDAISAGLIAYGHRKKGDCSDIEVVQPPVPGGGAKIAQRLDRLIPRGRTPISDALKLAGETIAGVEETTTIVLVSDGIETCTGDPCAVAEALAKSSANLKIHVVGYAVDQKARAQLQCIADKGGGGYFTADDTSQLEMALSRVTKSIETETPIDVTMDVPRPDVSALSVNLDVTGPGTIRLKLAPWARMPYYWKVLNPETGEEIAKTKKPEISVPAGQYQIAWRQIEHGAREAVLPQIIDVKAGQTSEALITTGLQLVPPEGMQRPYYWQLLPLGADLEKDFRRRQAAAWYWVWNPVPVPPGEYALVLRQSEHGHGEAVFSSIRLEEGGLTQMPLDQGLSFAWPKAWGQIYYLKVTDSAGRVSKFRKAGPIVLPPGQYKLAVRLKEHSHSEADFGEIVVPESGFVDAALTSGIAFDTDMEGEFRIFAVNLDTGSEASMYKRWGPMPLGAGRYRIDLHIKGAKRQTLVPELAIEEGQFVTANMRR